MQINKDILINKDNIKINFKGESWVTSFIDKVFNINPKKKKKITIKKFTNNTTLYKKDK
jgi:hypothetical protein